MIGKCSAVLGPYTGRFREPSEHFCILEVLCLRALFFSESTIDDGVSLLLGRIFRKLFVDEQVEPFLCCITGEMEQRLEGAAGDEVMLCQISVECVDHFLTLILF